MVRFSNYIPQIRKITVIQERLELLQKNVEEHLDVMEVKIEKGEVNLLRP
jgi:hypothetical protein